MSTGPDIFEFYDEENTTQRLDLNDVESGLYLARGFDEGEATLEAEFIQQAPYDGGEMAGSFYPVTFMVVPLLMARQDTPDDLQALYDLLVVELKRPTNVVRWKPRGLSTVFLIDTFKTSVPRLQHGQGAPSPYALKELGEPLVCRIPRMPFSRVEEEEP